MIKCIDVKRDNNGVPQAYVLYDGRQVKSYKKNDLKYLIRAKGLKVNNLTLTSDNRLLYTEETQNSRPQMNNITLKQAIAAANRSGKNFINKGLAYSIIGNDIYVTADPSNEVRERIESAEILKGTTRIDNMAFADCHNLTHIVIPNSVTSIGGRAFYSCNRLQNISIPNSVTSIGKGAFSCCDSLQNILIPNSLTSISEAMLYGCKSLQSIRIPDSVVGIEDDAFRYCTSLSYVILSNKLKTIGENAFWGCKSLKSIKIPDSVANIHNSAFGFCLGLQDIKICSNNVSIGNNAFTGISEHTIFEIVPYSAAHRWCIINDKPVRLLMNR